MENCSFCGGTIPFATGKMFVKKDAKILYFCSKRCEKNLLKLRRVPRDVRFTAAAKVTKKQHMAELAHEQKAKAAEQPEVEEHKTKKPAKKVNA